jgi:hypothetical protein
VLADVKGRARAPNGTSFKSHLNRLAPRMTLGGAKTQALDEAIEVRVRCAKACRARATGRLAGRSLEPGQREVPAGGTRTIAVELPRAARRGAAQALRQGEPVAARITVVATADSLTTRKSRLIKLRR